MRPGTTTAGLTAARVKPFATARAQGMPKMSLEAIATAIASET